MYSSFFLFSSLLIATTMAFPSYFPPNNYPPNNYPPYNYQTPPPPEDGGYTLTPPPSEDGGYTQTAPPPEDGGYIQTPPPQEDGGYTQTPPPPYKSNNYGNPPPAAASGDDKNVFLAGQNAARKAVTGANLPELAWNETLAAFALNYANQRKGDCALKHSGGPYGENIAQGSVLTAEESVKLWVDEKSLYDYASNKCSAGEFACLHYTQIIWKDTTQLGCAKIKCDNGGFFATCNYFPRGNYIGERPY